MLFLAKSTAYRIFWGIFLISLCVQSWIWTQYTYIDKASWVKEVHNIQTLEKTGKFYGYPATTLTMPSALLVRAGLPDSAALTSTIILLISLTIACIGLTIYKIQPKSLWWIAASGLLINNRLFLLATPPSAVIAPMCVLLTVLTLYIFLHKRSTPYPLLIGLGVCAGSALATRLDISLALFVSSVFLLSTYLSPKKILTIIGTAVAIFILLNPYMWTMPQEHLLDIYEKVSIHFQTMVFLNPFHLILLDSPLAVLSFVFSLIILLVKRNPQNIPSVFLVGLIGITIVLTIIFRASHYQPSWYFYPLFMIWETLLPAFILSLMSHLVFPNALLTVRRIQVLTVALLIGGQAVMLIHWYLLPEIQFILPITR